MFVTRRAPRPVIPEPFPHWLYPRLNIGFNLVDLVATFDSQTSFIPNPQASITDLVVVEQSDTGTANITVGTGTDFNVLADVSVFFGQFATPYAAIHHQLLFQRPPSVDAVIELLIPLFLQPPLQPPAASIDQLIADAAQAGFVVSIIGGVSDLVAPFELSAGAIEIPIIVAGETLENFSLTVSPSFANTAIDWVLTSETLASFVPGQVVAADGIQSDELMFSLALIQINATDATVESASSSSPGQGDIRDRRTIRTWFDRDEAKKSTS